MKTLIHYYIWKRYVDDTFVIIDTDKLSDFHIVLNNALSGFQFTLDKEKDSNLSFFRYSDPNPMIGLTLGKQAPFSEQGSKNIKVLPGDTMQTRV